MNSRAETDAQTTYVPHRPPRRWTAMLGGLEHSITEWGDPDGCPLLYLHGWGDTGSTFQFVVDQLAEPQRIVAPDLRGFGRSAHSGPRYWFPDYLADVDELADMLSPEQPLVVMGHSMGGNIAALYAGVRPERIAALVNMEGFGLPDSDPVSAPGRLRSWLERLRNPQPFSEYRTMEQLARRVLKNSPGMNETAARYVAGEWGIESADGRVRLRADAGHKLPNPVLYRRKEAEACWREISAATLLLCGDRSEFAATAKKQWENTGNPFPGARVLTLPEAGHMIHFEAPGPVAGAIADFLAGL